MTIMYGDFRALYHPLAARSQLYLAFKPSALQFGVLATAPSLEARRRNHEKLSQGQNPLVLLQKIMLLLD